MDSWSLAITAPNREFAISRMLTALGFSHHVFCVRKSVAYRGRVIDRLVPAFPGYIFVLANKAWIFLRELIGVVGFVHFGDGPIVVSKAVIERLCREADAFDVLPTPAVPARFERGQHVVIGGTSALSGSSGIFDRLVAHDRAVVFVPWLGRMAQAHVDESDLAPLVVAVKKQSKRRRPRRRRNHKINTQTSVSSQQQEAT